jgi:hypothetical protein
MSPKPIPLSDAQFAAVMAAAAPLSRQDVEGYLELVAEQLRARPIIGDGDVHRAVAVAQRCSRAPIFRSTPPGYARGEACAEVASTNVSSRFSPGTPSCSSSCNGTLPVGALASFGW